MRILLIEDDELLGEGLETALASAGHGVEWFRHGTAGLAAARIGEFDLLLLDLGLPGLDGVELLRRLRGGSNPLPVIIITARDTVDARVAGLDAGADDYLIKPFEVDELHARIRAVSRRRAGRAEPLLHHGELTLDPLARRATWRGEELALPRREFDLLMTLVENAGRIISRESLEQRLYGWQDDVASNAVEVYVHHLRKKLAPELIRTVRGVGYTVDRRG
jgi:two-component system, OmpR family, response regulator QseB